MRELRIQKNEAGQRLDKFLKKYLDNAPGSFLYKMLRKKNITLNGRKASGNEQLAEGDAVRLFLSEETIGKFRKKTGHGEPEPSKRVSGRMQAEPFSVIYEDEDILAVNKPPGLLCQSDRSGNDSLAELLVRRLLSEGKITREDLRAFRPSPVNRLDRNTSGIVLCGKSLRGLQFLSEMLRERTAEKEYIALVLGSVPKESVETAYYVRDRKNNRVILYPEDVAGRGVMRTGIRPLSYGRDTTEVLVRLITGKTHQIRAHLAYLGYPILGDPKYGDPERDAGIRRACRIKRQMLHAFRVTFPDTDGYFSYLSGTRIEAPLPRDMKRVTEYLNIR